MGETPPGGYLLSKHFTFPSFIVKNGQKKTHKFVGGFSRFQVFSSFFFLPFFALVFLLSLCLSTS